VARRLAPRVPRGLGAFADGRISLVTARGASVPECADAALRLQTDDRSMISDVGFGSVLKPKRAPWGSLRFMVSEARSFRPDVPQRPRVLKCGIRAIAPNPSIDEPEVSSRQL